MAAVELASREAGNKGRKADKETRRQQLIDATIDSLAKRGYSETTMADISDGAGLSRGIVNFYFDSKEKLLIETLQYLSDEYSAYWRAAVDKSSDTAAAKLLTLTSCDFDKKICNKRNLAAWCAFWGEAKSRPTYQSLCGARDLAYQNLFMDLCKTLIRQGNYPHDSEATAFALLSTLEGLWHRLMMGGDGLNADKARRVAQLQLVALFPKHFTVDSKDKSIRTTLLTAVRPVETVSAPMTPSETFVLDN